jgi:hypothetical protein
MKIKLNLLLNGASPYLGFNSILKRGPVTWLGFYDNLNKTQNLGSGDLEPGL